MLISLSTDALLSLSTGALLAKRQASGQLADRIGSTSACVIVRVEGLRASSRLGICRVDTQNWQIEIDRSDLFT